MFAENDDFEDFMDYIYDEGPYNYPARRYLRDNMNPLEEFDNDEFIQRYRFSKEVVINVLLPLVNLENHINNRRGLPIAPVLQILVALKFYATGHIQLTIGDLQKLSQSTICKIVARISRAIVLKVGQYIKFPPVNELNDVKLKFYQIARFPGVIGCIDCTHVPIQSPSRANGENYRNRKGTYSINVQLVCGPNMEIYDIVARWPGKVHDSRIFQNSRCCLRFEERELPGILIGDSGYAQKTYMYTPVINPVTVQQQRYNRSHISTRNIIERCNGVLKRRFACLGNKLRNKINNIPNIIVACAILHNICIMTRQEQPEVIVQEHAEDDDVYPDNQRGSVIRAAFISRHFNW